MPRKKKQPSCTKRIAAGVLAGAIVASLGSFLVAQGKIARLEFSLTNLGLVIQSTNR